MNNILMAMERLYLPLLMIIMGAMSHALNELHKRRNMPEQDLEELGEFTAIDFIILFLMALFSGGLFALSASIATNNLTMIGISGGMGGFLGINGLHFAGEIFKEEVGKRLSNVIGNKEKGE